ncbi:hypothetical protein B0H11DRAFT_2307357 [Mycena galericulata]|nr:hypothetical protein B0H11DRAFT_2307357 [Mycena galericulata]
MEDHDNDDQPPAQLGSADYVGASRGELLEALKITQQENTNLRAEVRTLRKENSDLLAVSSKKRRGRTDDKLGYKSEVVAWSKRFLFTRALCIDISIFSAKPSEFAVDPAATFATDDLYIESLTLALYQDIPEKFHELLDAKQYSNLAKDFIREHGDARSSLLNSVRKALPTILKGLDVDFDLLTTAGADRSNNAVLSGLLKFPTERKPTLYAPVLFPGPNKNMTELFLGPAVKKVHRLMYFGPGSLVPGSKPAPNSNGVRLSLKEVTASSISAAATVTRFVLSPDKEWASKGAISGTEWEQDYRTYHRLLTSNSHLPHVKHIFKTMQEFVFSGLKITSESASASAVDDDIEDAIADAMRQFELGIDTTTPDHSDLDIDVDGDGAAANGLNAAAQAAPQPIEVVAPAGDPVLISSGGFFRHKPFASDDNLPAHITDFQEAVKQLQLSSFEIPDHITAAILLCTLPSDPRDPESWYQHIQGIKIEKDKTTLVSVAQGILDAKRRTPGSDAPPSEAALAIALATLERSAREKGKHFCTNCRSNTHPTALCWAKGGAQEGQGPRQQKKKRGKGKKGKEKAHNIDGGDGDESVDSSFVGFEQSYVAPEVTTFLYSAHDVSSPSNSTSPPNDSPSADDQAYSARTTDAPPIIIDSGTSATIHSDRSQFKACLR